jgi:hypothetical protein
MYASYVGVVCLRMKKICCAGITRMLMDVQNVTSKSAGCF